MKCKNRNRMTLNQFSLWQWYQFWHADRPWFSGMSWKGTAGTSWQAFCNQRRSGGEFWSRNGSSKSCWWSNFARDGSNFWRRFCEQIYAQMAYRNEYGYFHIQKEKRKYVKFNLRINSSNWSSFSLLLTVDNSSSSSEIKIRSSLNTKQ